MDMGHIENLRAKADRCRRMAKGVTDPQVSRNLEDLAEDLEREIKRLSEVG